ncbi:MAG: hypothetical protein WC613_02435 [Candidatus Aenigmatarchaeota archaeon]
MAMFPKVPPEEGYAALDAGKTIQAGKGRGAIEIPMHETIYKGVEFLGKYFGWVTSLEKPKERKPKPPPKPEPEKKAGAYSRGDFGIGTGTLSYEMAERNLLADMAEHGYRQIELPEYQILRKGRELRLKKPEHDAVEEGYNTYINKSLYGLDGARVRGHEALGKHLRLVYGVPHGERTDNVMRPLEIPMVMAHARGEKDVLNRFAERAMTELRMAA